MKSTQIIPGLLAFFGVLSSTVLLAQVDLSLTLAQQGSPTQYTAYEVRATLTNDGVDAATTIAVSLPLPAGIVFRGGDEANASVGSFSPYQTQLWSIDTLEAGGTATLTLNLFLLDAEAPVYYGQVQTATEEDSDSTPGNGTPPTVNEDDESSTEVVAPPVPSCNLAFETLSVSCNEQATLTDPSDDLYVLDLKGINPGTTGEYRATLDGTFLGLGVYGFDFQAVEGPLFNRQGDTVLITLTDLQDTTCQVSQTIVLPSTCSPDGPELSLANLSIDSGSPSNGSLTYTFDLSNSGPVGVSQSFLVQSYLSVDTVLSADDVQNGTIATSSFNALEVATDVAGLSDVSGLTPGDYFLILFVDANRQVAETDETNNLIHVPFTVEEESNTGSCQLNVSAVSVTCRDANTPTFVADDVAEIMFTVTNGDATGFFTLETADGTSLGFGALGNPSRTFIQDLFNLQGDTLDFIIRSSVDSTCTASLSVILPSTCSPDGPELSLSNLSIDAGSPSNGSLNYTFDLMNAGAVGVSQSFLIQSYLSVDSVLSADDVQNGTIATSSFGAMETATDVAGLSDISILAPGDYFLILFVDANRQVAETDETNNLIRVPFTVGEAPTPLGADLELEGFSYNEHPSIFEFATVNLTIFNRGDEVVTGIFLSAPTPAGVVYRGGSEYSVTQGFFSPYGDQRWNVGSLAPGDSATLFINYFLRTDDGFDQYAEIDRANEQDVDSTPGNGTPNTVNEDDEVYIDVLTLGTRAVANLKLAPNPAVKGQGVQLLFNMTSTRSVPVLISDLNGREVYRQRVELTPGFQTVEVPTGQLQPGVYFVALPDTGLAPRRLVVR